MNYTVVGWKDCVVMADVELESTDLPASCMCAVFATPSTSNVPCGLVQSQNLSLK